MIFGLIAIRSTCLNIDDHVQSADFFCLRSEEVWS